jgi:hypothetical protein
LRNDFERSEDISTNILPDTDYKEAQSRSKPGKNKQMMAVNQEQY